MEDDGLSRSVAGGRHAATPSEVFVTVLFHFMIKVIVGHVGPQCSAPGINQ